MKSKFILVLFVLLFSLFTLIPIIPVTATNSPIVLGYHAYDEEVIPYMDWTAYWENVYNNIQWNLEWLNKDKWVSSKSELKVTYLPISSISRKVSIEFVADNDGDFRLSMTFKTNVSKVISQTTYTNIVEFGNNIDGKWAIKFDYNDIYRMTDMKIDTKVEKVDKITTFKFNVIKSKVVKGNSVIIDPMIDYYNTGDDAQQDFFGAQWIAQTFTTSQGYLVKSIKVKMLKSGSPGTLTVSIRATTGGATGTPTGPDLTSGTIDANSFTGEGAWYEIDISDIILATNTVYAIVCRVPSGDVSNKGFWRYDTSSPTYTGGRYQISYDSGVTWAGWSAADFMFEMWGDPTLTTVTTTVVTIASVTGTTTSTVTARTTTLTSTLTGGTSTVSTITYTGSNTTTTLLISLKVTSTIIVSMTVYEPVAGTLTGYETTTTTSTITSTDETTTSTSTTSESTYETTTSTSTTTCTTISETSISTDYTTTTTSTTSESTYETTTLTSTTTTTPVTTETTEISSIHTDVTGTATIVVVGPSTSNSFLIMVVIIVVIVLMALILWTRR